MSRRSHKNFRKCGGRKIIGQGSPSGYDATKWNGCGVVDSAGTVWISNGTPWDVLSIDLGSYYGAVDQNGSFALDQLYYVAVGN